MRKAMIEADSPKCESHRASPSAVFAGSACK
jgi:hypothetical protein